LARLTGWVVAKVLDMFGEGRAEWLSVEDGRVRERRSAAPEGRTLADHDLLGEDLWLHPGFVDAHTHLIGMGLSRTRPDLSSASSRDAALDLLQSWLRAHPGESRVLGEGWDHSTWRDARPPTRRDIDRVESVRPIALRRVCGHVAVLNSAAFREVGIAWPDLDPESGLAREELPLALPLLWPATPEEEFHAVVEGQREALRHGVTEIHEMGHERSYRAFAAVERAGELKLRTLHYFGADHLPALRTEGVIAGAGSDRLRVGGLKLFLDGSFGGRSAALREPYADAPPGSGPDAGPDAGRGRLLWDSGALRELIEAAYTAGLPVAMHAIGDRAIDQAVQVIESVTVQPPTPPRLEHAEVLAPDLLSRAVNAGMRFSMQPNFTAAWQGSGQLYEQALGPKRAAALNPYRSVWDARSLAFGSDTMPMGPLFGLRGALGHPLKAQRLSLGEALAAYTFGGARCAVRPFGASTISPGARVDWVLVRIPRSAAADAGRQTALLDRRDPEVLDGATIVATWVDGEEVFRA